MGLWRIRRCRFHQWEEDTELLSRPSSFMTSLEPDGLESNSFIFCFAFLRAFVSPWCALFFCFNPRSSVQISGEFFSIASMLSLLLACDLGCGVADHFSGQHQFHAAILLSAFRRIVGGHG